MEAKEQFIHKIASVVADIPEDKLDKEIYAKFAKDVTGGVVAGRSFIATVDDVNDKMKLAALSNFGKGVKDVMSKMKGAGKSKSTSGSGGHEMSSVSWQRTGKRKNDFRSGGVLPPSGM